MTELLPPPLLKFVNLQTEHLPTMIHSGGSSLVRCRSLIGSTKRIVISYGCFDIIPAVTCVTRPMSVAAAANESQATPTSTTSTNVTTSQLKKESPHLLQGSNAHSLGNIVRHGRGDACITLN